MNVQINSLKVDGSPKLEISCDDAQANIYYTLDGSAPNDGSFLYDKYLDYPNYTTVKAVAYKGVDKSEIVEYQCSVPIVYFNGHINVANSVDFLGGAIEAKSITLHPSGKIYNAINTKSCMIYPLGLNLTEHYVQGKPNTNIAYWAYKEGQILYDSKLKKLKFWNGTEWVDNSGYSIKYVTKGSTDQRPTLTNADEGFEYYDSTLKKKILWNGIAWVNIDGTAL